MCYACRALASASKQHMLDAIHAALRSGLQRFSAQDTIGQSGLLTCLARVYPGKHFPLPATRQQYLLSDQHILCMLDTCCTFIW
jgi:hypothetical protein